jgi:hypothetical protein
MDKDRTMRQVKNEFRPISNTYCTEYFGHKEDEGLAKGSMAGFVWAESKNCEERLDDVI